MGEDTFKFVTSSDGVRETSMTEHLPECWATYPSDPPAWCICDELRACEERVEESMDRAWSQTVQLAVAHTRTATLDAAREAVLGAKAIDVYYGRGLDDPPQFIWLNNALAAIDALMEGHQP
jgi:hypothetical protein